LFLGLLFNWILNPTRSLLGHLDHTEYDPGGNGVVV
jgi:hypothetical protein